MLIAGLVWECLSRDNKSYCCNSRSYSSVLFTLGRVSTRHTVTVSDGPGDISISPTVRGSAITLLPNNPSHDRACAL